MKIRICRPLTLLTVLSLSAGLTLANLIPVGYISYDNIVGNQFAFDISNQTGPNSTPFPDPTFPVATTLQFSNLVLTVTNQNGSYTCAPSGVSCPGNPNPYFTLAIDNQSYIGTLFTISAGNEPVNATLQGTFSTSTVTLNDGSTWAIAPAVFVDFTGLQAPVIADTAGVCQNGATGCLNDGDLAVIYAQTTPVPEPRYGATGFVMALLSFWRLRKNQAIDRTRRLSFLAAIASLATLACLPPPAYSQPAFAKQANMTPATGNWYFQRPADNTGKLIANTDLNKFQITLSVVSSVDASAQPPVPAINQLGGPMLGMGRVPLNDTTDGINNPKLVAPRQPDPQMFVSGDVVILGLPDIFKRANGLSVGVRTDQLTIEWERNPDDPLIVRADKTQTRVAFGAANSKTANSLVYGASVKRALTPTRFQLKNPAGMVTLDTDQGLSVTEAFWTDGNGKQYELMGKHIAKAGIIGSYDFSYTNLDSAPVQLGDFVFQFRADALPLSSVDPYATLDGSPPLGTPTITITSSSSGTQDASGQATFILSPGDNIDFDFPGDYTAYSYFTVQAQAATSGPGLQAFAYQYPVTVPSATDLTPVTVQTNPSGLDFTVDEEQFTSQQNLNIAPGDIAGVNAPPLQMLNGTEYAFQNWSDGGPQFHAIAVGDDPVMLTATYAALSQPPAAVQLNVATAPDNGVAGVTRVSITALGVPSGAITPGNVGLAFSPQCGSPALITTTASTVTTIIGTSRRINLAIPSGLSPGLYFVSAQDTAAGDVNFASSNCSEIELTSP